MYGRQCLLPETPYTPGTSLVPRSSLPDRMFSFPFRWPKAKRLSLSLILTKIHCPTHIYYKNQHFICYTLCIVIIEKGVVNFIQGLYTACKLNTFILQYKKKLLVNEGAGLTKCWSL